MKNLFSIFNKCNKMLYILVASSVIFILSGSALIFIQIQEIAIQQSFNSIPIVVKETVLKPVVFFTLPLIVLSFMKLKAKEKLFLMVRSKKVRLICLLAAIFLTVLYVFFTVSSLIGFIIIPFEMDITFFLWRYNTWLFLGISTAFFFGLNGC